MAGGGAITDHDIDDGVSIMKRSVPAPERNVSAALGSMPATNTATYAARHSAWLSAFDRFASGVTRWAGSPVAFGCAFLTILVWALLGPVFHFSEDWQLVINTGTTIITFLMVFLIQQSQNKDSVAVHLKLNELLAANRKASNRMIGIEQLDEQDLREVAGFYLRLAERAKIESVDQKAHSIDDEVDFDAPTAVDPAMQSRS